MNILEICNKKLIIFQTQWSNQIQGVVVDRYAIMCRFALPRFKFYQDQKPHVCMEAKAVIIPVLSDDLCCLDLCKVRSIIQKYKSDHLVLAKLVGLYYLNQCQSLSNTTSMNEFEICPHKTQPNGPNRSVIAFVSKLDRREGLASTPYHLFFFNKKTIILSCRVNTFL